MFLICFSFSIISLIRLSRRPTHLQGPSTLYSRSQRRRRRRGGPSRSAFSYPSAQKLFSESDEGEGFCYCSFCVHCLRCALLLSIDTAPAEKAKAPAKPAAKKSGGTAKASSRAPTPAVQTAAGILVDSAPAVVQAAVSVPVLEATPRDLVEHVALADFVPETVPRGHVPARVSRSMTANGAQPLVISDVDGASIERQALQAHVARRALPPPSPPSPPPSL